MKKIELSDEVLTKLSRLLDQYVDGRPESVRFEEHAAFAWDGRKKSLKPVKRSAAISADDLIGIDAIKLAVMENTARFIGGARSNNILLWGERGTGKSSLIKSLLAAFTGSSLRLIQVQKHDILSIPDLYDLFVVNSSFRFIIYIDDLSFEEGQTDYKEIKTVLDGGLEAVPENVLFYATSNRKHLIPTRFSDNDSDEIRPSDTVEEKMSLVERFGLRFGFYHFSQETYLQIVASYCRKYGVSLTGEGLNRLAIQWATQAGGRNGRIAEQFARSLSQGK
jgi:predicted AAA+ superfamily ATPase